MDDYAMSPAEAHYHHHQHQHQQRQWLPHLLPPMTRGPSSFPSPVSPAPQEFANHQQNPFYQHQPSLSLNMSSLSVTSPPVSQPNSAIDPATPISPSASQHSFHAHLAQSQTQQQQQAQQGQPGTAQQFSFHHDPYPASSSRPSSSSSSGLPRKRSFTATSGGTNASGSAPETLIEADEDSMFDDLGGPNPNSTSGAYDDVSYGGVSAGGGGNSPIDGTGGGGSSGDDVCGGIGQPGGMIGGAGSMGGMGVVGSSGIGMAGAMGKPLATNNFVTKLYQMINDPKSANFIVWTDLGTSFVVSNVGEFSRSILGSHFKHNNFSSFVRQLNMYGFHKINRTPRAQRTSTDAQTWEFSHRKFLRGRPDLLDEIKRKALEPDPGVKQRVELPGEVAAQLGSMRDDNRRMWEQLTAERNRVEKLTHVVGRLWDIVAKAFPHVGPFPTELLDPIDIFVTSPVDQLRHNHHHAAHTPPSLSAMSSLQSLHCSLSPGQHSLSPNSSPTAADFPAHLHQPSTPQGTPGTIQQQNTNPSGSQSRPSLSRQQSFQHVSFSRGPSASPVDMYMTDPMTAGLNGSASGAERNLKRPRTATDTDDHMSGAGSTATSATGSPLAAGSISAMSSPAGTSMLNHRTTKPLSRARSDSAPLGLGVGGMRSAPGSAYGAGYGGYAGTAGGGSHVGRPRSGSGMGVPGMSGMGVHGGSGLSIPNIGGRTTTLVGMHGGMVNTAASNAASPGPQSASTPTQASQQQQQQDAGGPPGQQDPGTQATMALPMLANLGAEAS